MKGKQLRRLQKLEKQIGEDRQDFVFRDIELIYKECPNIIAVKDELLDHIIRNGADPPDSTNTARMNRQGAGFGQ
jgi:hypothetical protein